MSECTIVVTIDPTSDPIAGSVRDGAGASTEFVGYAHLVAAIEHHRELAGWTDRGDNGCVDRNRGRD